MKKLAYIALNLLFASVASADGDVILSGNAGGVNSAKALIQGNDGRLYFTSRGTSEFAWLFAFEADGLRAANFASSGRTPLLGGDAGALAMRPDGSLITGNQRISTFSPAGLQLSSLLACGLEFECPGYILLTNSYLPNADGSTWGGGGFDQGMFSTSWSLKKIAPSGSLDMGFAGGSGWTLKDGGTSWEISLLRGLPNGQIIAIGTSAVSRNSEMSRFNADGSTDLSFGGGHVTLGNSIPYPYPKAPLAIDTQLRFLVPGGSNLVARRNADGSLDNTYTAVVADGSTQYSDFAMDLSGRVVVFGTRAGMIYVARLLADGGLDPSFGNAGEAIFAPPGVVNANGLRVSAGIVDASDRPVVYFDVLGIANGDLGLARLTTSGALDATFGAGWIDGSGFPALFSFAGNTAPFGTPYVVSDALIPAFVNAPATVRLSATTRNSAFSIGCNGTFVTAPAQIQPGETICLRHAAPSIGFRSATTTVLIGDRIGTYTTTATGTPVDTTPHGFTFTDQTNVAINSAITSNSITVAGIAADASISVTSGQYSIGCNPALFTSSSGVIANGQSVCVRVTSSANFATDESVTLTIGGVADTFTATTLAADTTPDAFAFVNQNNVAAQAVVISNAATIAGINAPAAITVNGGDYSIGCNGNFTAAAGTISSGQAVCVRHTASALGNTTLTTILNIGGVAGSFSSTTAAAAPPPPRNNGGSGAMSARDLALLALLLLVAQLVRLRKMRRAAIH